MIGADVDPGLVASGIVDAIGTDLAKFGKGEIVNTHFFRLTLWLPLGTRVSNQLLLLGIN